MAVMRAKSMIPYKSPLLTVVPQTLQKRLEIAEAIRTLVTQEEDEQLRRRRADIAALSRDLEQIAHDLRKARHEWASQVRSELQKYSPDQPRVPAGNPDGGQWTNGDGSRSRDGTGHVSNSGTRYAALETGTLTDATEGAPSDSQAHDNSAEPRIELAGNDWRNLPVNLVDEEAPNGPGHAIARHVDKSEAELISQFPQQSYYGLIEDYIRRREGSFDSIENANDLVNRTLRLNSDQVDLVANGTVDDDFITYRFGFVTGDEVVRLDPYGGQFEPRKTYGVGVYIVHDSNSPRGFRVITAYPMNFD